MKNIDEFDSKKRRTIKLMAGSTASSMFIGMSAFAVEQSVTTSGSNDGDLIDCQLIVRADRSRAHLLVNNRTNSELAVIRFGTQLIQFKDTTLNMAEAYVEPVIVPSNDRVMVRLNLEAGLQHSQVNSDVVDVNSNARHLPQGTCAVALTVRLIDGVGSVEGTSGLV